MEMMTAVHRDLYYVANLPYNFPAGKKDKEDYKNEQYVLLSSADPEWEMKLLEFMGTIDADEEERLKDRK